VFSGMWVSFKVNQKQSHHFKNMYLIIIIITIKVVVAVVVVSRCKVKT